MRLKLARMAVLGFPDLPEQWRGWRISIDDIELTSLGWGQSEDNHILLWIATIMDLTSAPDLTPDRRIVVPETERKQLETAIESVANLISVAEGTRRSISSPSRCVALIPGDDEARAFLENAESFSEVLMHTLMKAEYRIDVVDKLTALADRTEGVTLLAESIAQEHQTGKFHEYVRLFERAFNRSGEGLVQPLLGFLSSSRFGYTEVEVRRWLRELRNPATHGDRGRPMVFESGILPVVWRMEQAAYDVVFNKAEWHNPSTGRRDIWRPTSGTSSSSGSMLSTQGVQDTFRIQMLDEFAAFPKALIGGFETLPDNWWSKQVPRDDEVL